MIKDSGTRQEFPTGAVRDIQKGKGRCDLLPLDVIADCYRADFGMEEPEAMIFDNIDAYLLEDKLYDNEFAMLCPLDEVCGVIEDTPTVDAVEVVRCKDCRLEGAEECPMVHKDAIFGNLYAETKGDDFCSYGERRSG